MARLLRVLIPLLAIVVSLLAPALAHPVGAEDSRYFPETGVSVEGDFYYYWRDNGGMTRLGLPLTPPTDQRLETGPGPSDTKVFWTQIFERGQLQFNPDRPAGQKIQETLLGKTILDRRNPAGASTPAPSTCSGWMPAETGHCLTQADFLAYYQTRGGLAAFGFPLTETFNETLEDGKVYTVQYFQRVRMELHPESADPAYRVQLGQFGRQIVQSRQGGVWGENKLAACNSITDQRPPQLNVPFPLPGAADRLTIFNAWSNQPGAFSGEKKLLVTPKDQYKFLLGGTYWQWSWSCEPEVRENFRKNGLTVVTMSELQQMGLLR